MRIERYGCDQCGKEFGDLDHINVKQGQLFISTKKQNGWRSIPVRIPCREYHFCDPTCINAWITKQLYLAMDNLIKERNETIPNREQKIPFSNDDIGDN